MWLPSLLFPFLQATATPISYKNSCGWCSLYLTSGFFTTTLLIFTFEWSSSYSSKSSSYFASNLIFFSNPGIAFSNPIRLLQYNRFKWNSYSFRLNLFWSIAKLSWDIDILYCREHFRFRSAQQIIDPHGSSNSQDCYSLGINQKDLLSTWWFHLIHHSDSF